MEDRIKYLENQFNLNYSYLENVSSYFFYFTHDESDPEDREKKEYAEYWSHVYLYKMYNILCVYFETLGLKSYLDDFKEKYGSIVKDKKKSTEISFALLEYGNKDDDLFLIIEWKKFLAPFKFFWDYQNNEKEKSDKKLIRFLECTNEILKITKTKINHEGDINSIIKEVANFFFSGVTAYSEGYFVHQFKHYKPDLIIKELETAVEYKLIRTNKDIGIKLDELLIDARRYAGNQNNKHCIAVFCLSDEVRKTRKEIKEEWDNMQFPANWEIVIITNVRIDNKNTKATV